MEILNGFWMDFGRIWGRFLKLMGRIAFQVEELALMIRPTRSTSMHPWTLCSFWLKNTGLKSALRKRL